VDDDDLARRWVYPDRPTAREHAERRPFGEVEGTFAGRQEGVAAANRRLEVGVVVDVAAVVREEKPWHPGFI
jgi:hypothetical protein